MDNENTWILLGATTAVGSFEIALYMKNLITAFNMKEAPPDYEGMKGEEFVNLRAHTITRSRYEVGGTIMNCGLLAAKIWLGYYPILWQETAELLGKSSFIAYWGFQFVDTFANKLIFAPTKAQITKSRGVSGVQLRSLALGHMSHLMPVGFLGLVIMIFATDVNPKIWFFLPLVASFDEALLTAVKHYRCKKLIKTDADSPITKQVMDVAAIFNFPKDNIYKNLNEKEIPEVNYYELARKIVISEKLMSMPEKTAVLLISQEISLSSTRSSSLFIIMQLIRYVGLGFLLMKSFGSDLVSQVFGFDNTPYPYVPMYLAYAYVWPVFSNILYRIECLFHSWNILKADSIIHQSTSNQGVIALKSIAGQAEKYPLFDTWYSQLIRGYPTVAQRIRNLEGSKT